MSRQPRSSSRHVATRTRPSTSRRYRVTASLSGRKHPSTTADNAAQPRPLPPRLRACEDVDDGLELAEKLEDLPVEIGFDVVVDVLAVLGDDVVSLAA